MNIGQAIILGIVQGLTEFIPVSSSGHLVLLSAIFRWPLLDITYNIFLHFGTLIALIIFFHQELAHMARAIFPGAKSLRKNKEMRLLFFYIILSALITFIIAIFFNKPLENLFENPPGAAFFLLITGLILWMTPQVKEEGKEIKKTAQEIGVKDAIIIGLSQGAALVPGISRMGITISASLHCKLGRELALRYSFILAIVAIAGATLYKLKEIIGQFSLSSGNLHLFIIGGLSAGISGYLAIKLVFAIVRQARLRYFSYYCWALGLGALLYLGARP